jgi:hypothetical protein
MKLLWVAAAVTAIVAAQVASAGQRWRERPPAGPSAEEAEAAAWVNGHLAADAVIAAIGDGQRIGYYTRRPTVAVPNPRFTERAWDLTALQAVVLRYRVRAILVTGEEGAAFLARGIPGWLIPDHEASGVRIFRISSDTVPRRDRGEAR